ncbi:lectizyme-like [Cochliomyia hominivorax]
MVNVSQKLITIIVLIFAFVKLSWCLTMNMGRVVGGADAAVNSAPFIVSFQHSGIHYCAGSILNKNWIITAAHCLSSKTLAKNTVLVAGSIHVAGTAKTTQRRTIDYYITHDLYLGGSSPYDIGLVYTKKAFIWSNAVAAISLPASESSATGNAILYGWGSISKTNNAIYPTLLQVATVQIIPLKTCEKALGAKGHDVHYTNLCTGPLTGGVGICTSDSGGPLIQNLKGKPILVGIVSWGKLPCGQINSPSIFVKVSSFIKWIEKHQVVPK